MSRDPPFARGFLTWRIVLAYSGNPKTAFFWESWPHGIEDHVPLTWFLLKIFIFGHFLSFLILVPEKSHQVSKLHMFFVKLWILRFLEEILEIQVFLKPKKWLFWNFPFFISRFRFLRRSKCKKKSGYETPQIWCFSGKTWHMVWKVTFP